MEITNAKKYTKPFEYYVIDDFISEELAQDLYSEFPEYDSLKWYSYDNPLERKKAIQFWGAFGPKTYQFFMELCSEKFTQKLRDLTGNPSLIPDIGLHGAGWHMSKTGDHLNMHQDYSMHPLADMQRKYNIIIYLTPDWKPEWGGNLELWSHDIDTNKAKDRVASIDCLFRRAIIFNTTQNSWHGFPDDITCPEGVYRRSIAMYYLDEPDNTAVNRKRALYSPRKDQENNEYIKELIEKRAKV